MLASVLMVRAQPRRCEAHQATGRRTVAPRAKSQAPMGKVLCGGKHEKAPRLTDCETENATPTHKQVPRRVRGSQDLGKSAPVSGAPQSGMESQAPMGKVACGKCTNR